MSLAVRLDALAAAQRVLWPQLIQVSRQFVLYGGTALALRLGHRTSVDFDFFTNTPIDSSMLRSSISFLAEATVLQVAPNTLTVSVSCPEPVKVSFFGGLRLGRVADPEPTHDGVALVASLLDLAACKMAVLPERAESKDYLDVYALLQNGVSLSRALGAARAVYGECFNPMPALKALAYFQDGDLPALPEPVKQALRNAAAAVREIEVLERLPGGLRP